MKPGYHWAKGVTSGFVLFVLVVFVLWGCGVIK